VTLARELELLERYVAIQQARFSDRLRVSVRAAPDTLAASVPHMLLQPLVENAIRHGIAPREAPGAVTVEATRRGDRLRLVVRDDGVGFGRAPEGAGGRGVGLGLAGTRARLAHLYGDRCALEIADAAPTGTVVTVEIPFRTEAPERPSDRRPDPERSEGEGSPMLSTPSEVLRSAQDDGASSQPTAGAAGSAR
jgi:LytS/YehU family sensor histidine kinase